MSPCYVAAYPDGWEQGVYYAIDLGGTTFRVLRVVLGAERGRVEDYWVREVTVPKEVLHVTDTNLVEFMAKSFVKHYREAEREAAKKAQRRSKQGASGASGAGTSAAGASGPGLDASSSSGASASALDAPSASRPLPIGFCFSYAFSQTSPHDAFLECWTKAFRGDGLIGKDVVAALEGALHREGLEVRVAAVVNDTVSTLFASLYRDPATALGVILGTGTNAAALLPTDEVHDSSWLAFHRKAVRKLEEGKGAQGAASPGAASGDAVPRDAASEPSSAAASPLDGSAALFATRAAINTEWGDAYSHSFATTPEDAWLDAASPNPGRGLLEKQVSGMYLGEVVRRVLVCLDEQGALFGGQASAGLLQVPFSFSSAAVAAIHADGSSRLDATGLALAPYGATSLRARKVVKAACEAVARRSARVAAAAIVAGLRRSGWRDADVGTDADPCTSVTVAVDGSVFSKFAGYRVMVAQALEDILGTEAAERVRMRYCPDGSGLGAAYLAAAAVRAGVARA